MNMDYCRKQKHNGEMYLLKIVKMADHLALLILDESAAYMGKATDNYLKETAAYFSVSTDNYCSDVEKCIKDPQNININLTNDRFYINKKVGKMTTSYFSVDLEQMDFGTMAIKFATELLSLYQDVNLKVVEADDKLLQAQSSIELYKEKLEKYTKDHINSEHKLHSSFLLILNEKKRQLQFYKDLLDKTLANQISKSPTRIILSDDENLEDSPDIFKRGNKSNSKESYNIDDEKQSAAANSTNNGYKRVWSSIFDSDGEPLPGPSNIKYAVQSINKSWEKNKSADFDKKSSAVRLDIRSKSDSNLNEQLLEKDFNINYADFDKEFDDLELDPTPPPKLPKRNKSSAITAGVTTNLSQRSQIVQNSENQDSLAVLEESPTLNFTTQDLFDRM